MLAGWLIFVLFMLRTLDCSAIEHKARQDISQIASRYYIVILLCCCMDIRVPCLHIMHASRRVITDSSMIIVALTAVVPPSRPLL